MARLKIRIQDEKPALMDRIGFRLLLPAVVSYESETDTDFSFGSIGFSMVNAGLDIRYPTNWTLGW